MARDNGTRGSYRHVSGSLAKSDESIELEHSDLVGSSPHDSDASPPLPTTFQNLRRDEADLLCDKFFDSIPSSLNARYPIMAVPGSLPRRSLIPQQIGRDQSPTWYETLFAAGLLSFVIFGFFFTIYSGFSAIGAYVWALVADLVAELFGKSG